MRAGTPVMRPVQGPAIRCCSPRVAALPHLRHMDDLALDTIQCARQHKLGVSAISNLSHKGVRFRTPLSGSFACCHFRCSSNIFLCQCMIVLGPAPQAKLVPTGHGTFSAPALRPPAVRCPHPIHCHPPLIFCMRWLPARILALFPSSISILCLFGLVAPCPLLLVGSGPTPSPQTVVAMLLHLITSSSWCPHLTQIIVHLALFLFIYCHVAGTGPSQMTGLCTAVGSLSARQGASSRSPALLQPASPQFLRAFHLRLAPPLGPPAGFFPVQCSDLGFGQDPVPHGCRRTEPFPLLD